MMTVTTHDSHQSRMGKWTGTQLPRYNADKLSSKNANPQVQKYKIPSQIVKTDEPILIFVAMLG